ncbi:hypothetical protein CYMTET_50576 [Cymbomonas tetramitiformis]|uniref:Uncharacterized protein n=1 Tax=Cymbomonas tetramitiformis TaxID=36881 RepID=A0AAE0BPT7_9CHLO|nr:hypothetical protein CYMTET_50576 [Cymbomonas tetramitiformis]
MLAVDFSFHGASVTQGKYLKLGFEDPFPGLPKPPLTGAKVLAGYDRLDHHDPIHMHIEMLKKAGWSETEIEKIFTEDEEWFTDTMPPELKDILSRREQAVEDLDTPDHNGDGEDDEDDGDDFNFTRRELANASVTSIPPSVPTQAATAGSLHTAELMVVSEAADVSTVHPSVPTQATTARSLRAAEPMVVSEATTASTVHLSMPAQAATASSLHAAEPMVVSEAAIASRIHPSVPAQAATAGYMHAAEPMVVSEATTTSSIPSLAVGIAGTHTSHSFASPPQLLGHGTDREVAVARLQEMREIADSISLGKRGSKRGPPSFSQVTSGFDTVDEDMMYQALRNHPSLRGLKAGARTRAFVALYNHVAETSHKMIEAGCKVRRMTMKKITHVKEHEAKVLNR